MRRDADDFATSLAETVEAHGFAVTEVQTAELVAQRVAGAVATPRADDR